MKVTIDMTEKVVLRNVRFDWVQTFTPKKYSEEDEPKYSIAVILPKNHPQRKEFEDASLRVAVAGHPGVEQAKFKLPLRDGDKDKGEYLAYQGQMFFNGSATVAYPPGNITGVVKTRVKQPDGTEKLVFMDADAKSWGSGDYGTISVELYAFKKKGNIGTAAGINMVQFTKKGEPLGKRDHSGDFEAAPTEEAGDDNY